MTCEDFLRRYSEYDDSLLPSVELDRFRAHMAACPACERYDRVLRKGRMLARQVAARPSPDFLPRLHSRLLAEPSPRPLPVGPVAAGGFLTLALAAVAGMWLPGGSGAVKDGIRVTSLPSAALVGPADWTAGRVAGGGASSYSPLVIGPPAYAAEGGSLSTGLTSTTRRTLD